MTMKLKGRKASLYATAMAISLVALSGTAHAQSASNGKFKASALPTAEATRVKATTTKTDATLTAAQIAALPATKASTAKKVDMTVRNEITAEVLGSLSAASKAAYDAAVAANADLTAKNKSVASTAATLNATGTAVADRVITNALGAANATQTLTVNGAGTLVGTTYITNDATKVGKLVWTGGNSLNGATQVWAASATAAKTLADTEVQNLITARTSAGAEVAAASAAVVSLQNSLNQELAAATPNAATVATRTAALEAGQQRLALASTAQATANANYTAAVSAADAANSAFQSATNAKIAADNAAVTSLSAKNFAEQAVATTLASDVGYKAAIDAVKKSTDPLVLVSGQTITQAQIDYYKTYGVDITALTTTAATAADTAASGTSTVGTTIAAGHIAVANASLAGATNVIARALTTDYASLKAAADLDDQELATTTTYASNGFTRTTGVLATAAASEMASISMASKALTDDAAALEVNAQFEIEVLDTLVNHETRITAIEDVVGDVTANTAAIATEVTERKAADAVLTTAIATEVTERKAADAALDTRVTATANGLTKEVADRIAADTANNNARIAEDKRLNDMIVSESSARVAMGNELRDRIASSTATAIALGGAALLPDMGFTLSGNVAFYEGAQAIALNAAAKVGPNAYVTAAAGGGLNKRGSVGGRVGFVIGF